MNRPINPIPEGFTALTPYISVKGAAAAISFYERAFGAREVMRLTYPDGTIAHAQLTIGDAQLMLADEHPEYGAVGPTGASGASVRLQLFVADVDAVVAQAAAAGATVQGSVADQFYGERAGRLVDPFGHHWIVSTRIEEVAPDEMQRRMEALM